MSDMLELNCWIFGDDPDHIFTVEVAKSTSISGLKKAIKYEGKHTFDAVDAAILKLWKVNITDLDSLNTINKDNIPGERLKSLWILSDVFTDRSELRRLHIIVQHLDVTITPSSSGDSNSSPDSTSSWLVDLHNKLWGKRDLFDKIFRTANLTESDFIKLQCQLDERNPDRISESYEAKDVLSIKSEFLRSRSFAEQNTATAHFDAGSNCNLAPQLVFDTSGDSISPISVDTVDDDAVDGNTVVADAVYADTMDIDPDPNSRSHAYIYIDADYLSKGANAVFPCTIRYMDLTVLNLNSFNRTPHLMLIRKEWSNMVDIFNRRKMGMRGGAVFTGQPGIGKTCFLYYTLILCIIRAQPIVFQDILGKVYLINDEVRHQKGTVVVPGDDVLTLVDADHESCIPSPYLLGAYNLRILLTSSPKSNEHRKWLTQFVGETGAVYIMKPWLREEFLVASLFLAPIDITLKRFQDATHICGHVPRQCFDAAVSPNMLSEAKLDVLQVFKGTSGLAEAIIEQHNLKPIHRAFMIYPSQDSRRWGSCLTQPVSDWAFSKMMEVLDQQGINAAYNFYLIIRGSSKSAALCGKMSKTKVHTFFKTITEPRSFMIRSLDDCSTTFDIKLSPMMSHDTFGANQHFASKLASSVIDGKSCYFQFLSTIFPTFDSFLYQHDMSQSGCQPLIWLQITTAHAHPISIKGLEVVQTCLTPEVPELKVLQPTTSKKWIILFVVPESMAAGFVKQQFKDRKENEPWQQKTAQYVLGLSEQEVMRSREG